MAEGQTAVNDMNQTPVFATWTKTFELGYESSANDNAAYSARINEPQGPVCFGCGKTAIESAATNNQGGLRLLSKCAKCDLASYCSKECQVQDWKPTSKGGGNHKHSCAMYGRLTILEATTTTTTGDGDGDGSTQNNNNNNNTSSIHAIRIKTEQDKESIRNEIFGRIRIYACSYAVFRTATLGRGFLFIQSDSTLATLSTPTPKNGFGRPPPPLNNSNNGNGGTRAILMHFLTLGEYDAEVCRDDFEMTMVRSQLQTAVETYDERKQVILLTRFRCGHVALGTATLVPDYAVCKTIGGQYFAENPSKAVQLNLDDM